MDKRYLIDTKTIIYYFDNKIPANQTEFIKLVTRNSKDFTGLHNLKIYKPSEDLQTSEGWNLVILIFLHS